MCPAKSEVACPPLLHCVLTVMPCPQACWAVLDVMRACLATPSEHICMLTPARGSECPHLLNVRF